MLLKGNNAQLKVIVDQKDPIPNEDLIQYELLVDASLVLKGVHVSFLFYH